MNNRITFSHNVEEYEMYDASDPFLTRGVSYIADRILHSKVFNILSLGRVHAYVHECGHALAWICVTNGNAVVNVSKTSCIGEVEYIGSRPSKKAETFVDLAGPLANLIFSILLVIGAFALTQNIKMPEWSKWGIKILVAGPALFWIAGELLYAIMSAIRKDGGDFGQIRERGWRHLFVAFLTLFSVLAIGALGLYMIQYGTGDIKSIFSQ